jgi:hypothetical protein
MAAIDIGMASRRFASDANRSSRSQDAAALHEVAFRVPAVAPADGLKPGERTFWCSRTTLSLIPPSGGLNRGERLSFARAGDAVVRALRFDQIFHMVL